MSSTASRTPSLTPSRSPTPEPPLQPHHFYGSDNTQHLPPSPDSDGRTWLDPADDPLAQRGIPVFKPTLEEFSDFEGYVSKIECWGMRSGIVKIVPPKEWTDALPALNSQLGKVKMRSPIEQHMLGRGGLFRQENIEKRRIMSLREWAELCTKEELRAPGVDDIGLHARAQSGAAKRTRRGRRKTRDSETAEPDAEAEIKQEELSAPQLHNNHATTSLASPPNSTGVPATPTAGNDQPEFVQGDSKTASQDVSSEHAPGEEEVKEEDGEVEKPKSKGKRAAQTRATKEAHLAERAAKDEVFLETFDPHSDWLPPNTTSFDYTPEFCKELERRYWRNCGLGKPAWYGADLQGSLFTEDTSVWNVASLPSALSRLLPASSKGLPGVNTPYLYFGMWRATFAWHVEDMDLFSINYIHFGAPKFWYAMPQGRAAALESTMRGYFPKDVSNCTQFLRHKSFLASPNLLSKDSCRPNTVVQQAGEFIITFPRGYHAGFNLGFNCAESVNFALESWFDLGRKAKACECVNFSVRIDVDQLLSDRAAERVLAEKEREKPASSKARRKSEKAPDKDGKPRSHKRKSDTNEGGPKAKKQKTSKAPKIEGASTLATAEAPNPKASSSKMVTSKVTLKLGPKPKELEVLPCCLCVNLSTEKLLRVLDPPLWRKEGEGAPGQGTGSSVWMAHEDCANVVPETWIDEIEVGKPSADGSRMKERVVFGVDAIVKDRWNLKCSACTKTRHRAHGAPIQCTKGKCPKAFHVTCARDGASHSVVYNVLREVEKEVVLLDYQAAAAVPPIVGMTADIGGAPGPSMDVDHTAKLADATVVAADDDNGPRVLKLIKKVEVQVLCSQHNPAVAEAKRAQKQDKIRNDLLAMPPMSRIKLRVSAGVFEVSLLRVIEESSSVEVLWDRGVKREFKWGSVVFGNTEGVTVGQKPAEPAPEAELQPPAPSAPQSRHPFRSSSHTVPYGTQILSPPMVVPLSIASATSRTPSSASPSAPSSSTPTPYQPQPPTYQPQTAHQPQYQACTSTYQYAPGAWASQYPTHYAPPPQLQYSAPGPSTQTYQYGSMQLPSYPNAGPYQPYSGDYNYPPPPPYQSRGLQWQRPYTGPKNSAPSSGFSAQPPTQTAPYYSYPPTHRDPSAGYGQQQWGAAPPASNASSASASGTPPMQTSGYDGAPPA